MLDILKEKFNNEIATRIFSFCSHPTADIINKAIEDGEKKHYYVKNASVDAYVA